MSGTESDADRVVATRANGGNSNNDAYHTDPDCTLLHGSDTRPVRDVEIQNKGLSECARCSGQVDRGTQPERTCPVCGDSVPSLARHLRHNCDGVDA